MSDDLVKRWDEYVESMGSVMGEAEHMAQQMRDRIEALERDLKDAVRALQIARVHVANNECGWSVSRGAARFDLEIIDHIMEKIGASYE